ncbi:hypothetical protein TRFO_15806 [Tritrichomonas foetus]|uniref:Sulfatase N-terminal domain-containing protein n=1 Tax=Tritrichomonas foetus TaxID=1144522 RepID=A0A1J4KWK2_9EUKA|nr:hypothetical protein TRFO_15806 [Tritrichomonas foetus]|eukprot:OHT13917.1 hypothetical protein TRFO_15806 [Tritrichomonas foetus]
MFFILSALVLADSIKVSFNGNAPITTDDFAAAFSISGISDNQQVTSLALKRGVFDISEISKMFPNLNELVMSKKATVINNRIPERCFYNSKLQKVHLENVQTIGKEAFAHSSHLVDFSAPGVIDIGLKSFVDCISLKSFVFPPSVTELPKLVLHGCSSLVNLTIEGAVHEIPEFFFTGMLNVRFVYIPFTARDFISPFSNLVNVTLIRPKPAKEGEPPICPARQAFEVPRFANNLGDYIFTGCQNLQHVLISENIQTIGVSAFANTPSLLNVTFAEPSKLFRINDYAFSNCSRLEYITLPETLRSNGKYIFAHSNNLKVVFVHSQFDFEWFSEGIIALTQGQIVELKDPVPEADNKKPRFTPWPKRPQMKPLTEEERKRYTPKKSNKKENIVFFFSDQQRWDTIGANGQKLDISPYLDQLAREGVNFRNCFTNQPVCGPVRAVIQTGLYATATGCFKNAAPLPDNQPNLLADELKKCGYNIAYIGKWHLASDQDQQHYESIPVPLKYRGGWDQYWVAADVLEFTSHGYGGYLFDQDNNKREFTGYRVDCVTDFALEYIRNYDDSEKPFALFLSHIEPHHQNDHFSYEGPEGSKEKFRDFEQPADLTKGKGDWETWMPDYLGCCNALDKNLGRLIEELKEKGIYDDTLIIYTSDHGCHFKSHTEDIEPGGSDDYKRSSYESALHIPFVAKGRDFYGGHDSDKIISSIDFPPTLIRAAGGTPPAEWRGRPIQDYNNPDWENVMYSQVSESYVGRLVRTHKWKYVIHAEGLRPFGDPGTDKDTWTDKHLFDLEHDPTEKNDLKDDPDYYEIKQQLRELLIEKAKWAGEGTLKIVDKTTKTTNDL